MKLVKSFGVLFVLVACCVAGIAHADPLGFGTLALQEGSSGQYVINLQTVLNTFAHDSLAVDGLFGSGTRLAVQEYQSSVGLVPDGVVGTATKAKLLEIQNAAVPATAPSIQFLSQSSGVVGTVVTITGSGFLPTNTVLFGGGPVIPTFNNSTSISFTVPSSVGADCQTNGACPMYARLITPAIYPVIVRNANGVSNALQFTVTAVQTPLTPTTTACTPVLITSLLPVPTGSSSMGIPTLEITSPVAGTTYHPGDTMHISWIACNPALQATLSINLIDSTNQGISIGSASLQSQAYDFIIPGTYTSPAGIVVNLNGSYKVWMMTGAVSDSSADSASSGSFTIAH